MNSAAMALIFSILSLLFLIFLLFKTTFVFLGIKAYAWELSAWNYGYLCILKRANIVNGVVFSPVIKSRILWKQSIYYRIENMQKKRMGTLKEGNIPSCMWKE